MKVHVVRKWKSPRKKYYECYQHSSRLVRWYFWKRLDVAFKMSQTKKLDTVLDVGCWMGYFLPTLSAYSKKVIGLDLWQETIKPGSYDDRVVGWTEMDIAQELVDTEIGKDNNIKLIKADATAMPLDDQSVNVAFCLDMMEHLNEQIDDLLRDLKRVLVDKGTLIVSLPNERGAALAARQIFSKVVKISRDKYSTLELIKSLFTGKVPVEMKKSHGSHKGYDYRNDVKKISEYFSIKKVSYVPIPFLFGLNPTIIIKATKE